ncbi:4'-phosphopantetheinyl transferase [Mesocricetibacter intestinalis]|uniref:4'-phosphopantetheinyl transferase n=1 Tax=Mesocricetibacter intestinalis TaxID=1521930 RepID=A0A4R6V8R4_9PAST|nr:4'-phosphopantetheinyl transferase superfamily protein [Mesocricetibacter intestinalis]TDQ57880.1 4'-phosphopantetheinyl transferase [Mesocricetibacter intestinalis]
MTTLIAWGSILQDYPAINSSSPLVADRLNLCGGENARVVRRRQSRRVAHFLLSQLMKKAGENSNLLDNIYRSASDRPQLPISYMDFNISHSGDWVAVVLNIIKPAAYQEGQPHKNVAVGIDIESPQKERNFSALLRHFAAPEEIAWFEEQANAEAAFYRIWCLREALLKSQGAGIAKLSEVRHNPLQQRMYSRHCPMGRQLFSAELPFYFSVFVAGEALSNAHFFQWQSNCLQEKNLNAGIEYLVNLAP